MVGVVGFMLGVKRRLYYELNWGIILDYELYIVCCVLVGCSVLEIVAYML